MSERGWWGVDLDGTLAKHEQGTWKGQAHIGEPIPLMVARVQAWLAKGREVRIVTARVASSVPPDDVRDAWNAIQKWCLEHIGQSLVITAEKDYQMVELWDDRAVSVETNTGVCLVEGRR